MTIEFLYSLLPLRNIPHLKRRPTGFKFLSEEISSEPWDLKLRVCAVNFLYDAYEEFIGPSTKRKSSELNLSFHRDEETLQGLEGRMSKSYNDLAKMPLKIKDSRSADLPDRSKISEKQEKFYKKRMQLYFAERKAEGYNFTLI